MEAREARVRLSEGALAVLREVVGRPMDGYTVMSRTRLTPDDLVKALHELDRYSLIQVIGEKRAPDVGEAYVWVSPDVKGYADFLLKWTP